MRGVPERVARCSAPLTSSDAHETPCFARLDLLESLRSERRSIDVAGVSASAIATVARTAWRGSPGRRDLSATSLAADGSRTGKKANRDKTPNVFYRELCTCRLRTIAQCLGVSARRMGAGRGRTSACLHREAGLIRKDLVSGRLCVLRLGFVHFARGLCPGRSELYQIRPQLGVAFGLSQSDAFAGSLQAFLRLFDHGDLTRRSPIVRNNRRNT
jgi:hypothetical protein